MAKKKSYKQKKRDKLIRLINAVSEHPDQYTRFDLTMLRAQLEALDNGYKNIQRAQSGGKSVPDAAEAVGSDDSECVPPVCAENAGETDSE